MTIHAKKQLVTDVTEEIGDFLTVTQTRQVGRILDEHLDDYLLTEKTQEETDPESQDLLKIFLEAKRTEGCADSTVKAYAYKLERIMQEIAKPVKQITVYDLRSYLIAEKNRGISDRTLDGDRAKMASFFGWLWKEKLIDDNPCQNLGPIKYAKEIRLPFTETEVEQMRTGCMNKRDLAMMYFFLYTGARVSEVSALNISDINFSRKSAKVFGKGRKERTVYFNDVTAMLLKAYLDSRTDDDPALFVGLKGDHSRLVPQGIRAVMKELEKRTGVTNIHPHRFRRTLASRLAQHGMPVQNIKEILGHENINTTMTYIYIDQHDVQSSYWRYA